MKKILLCLCLFYSSFSSATNFSLITYGALWSIDILDINYYKNYYETQLGKPYKQEQGAFWYKAGKPFYDLTIEDVFISDGTSDWIFVGVVVSGNPEKIADNFLQKRGTVFWKKNIEDKYSSYYSKYGTEILWFGENKSKIIYKVKSYVH